MTTAILKISARIALAAMTAIMAAACTTVGNEWISSAGTPLHGWVDAALVPPGADTSNLLISNDGSRGN
jgi:hypothetical protein